MIMATVNFTPEEQVAFVNEIMRNFAEGLDRSLRARLRDIDGKVPHETIKNLRYHIIEANVSKISAEWQLYFQDSGRHVEMKRLDIKKKTLNVDAILDWIKRGRASDFQEVPGYKEKPTRLSRAKQLERIAFVIAASRAKIKVKKLRERREKRWVNKKVYGWFNALLKNFIDQETEFLKQMVDEGLGDDLGKI